MDEYKIGDVVEVINTGLQYTMYADWIMKNVKDYHNALRFDYGSEAVLGKKYRIIAIAPHIDLDRTLVYIADTEDEYYGKCYLIGIEGLKKA